jgi:8-oxo-dGTP diphosphatase
MSIDFKAKPDVDCLHPLCSCSCSYENAPKSPQEPVLATVIPERPLVGICLCIRRNGSVLLHKRLGNHAPNTWAFPGGYLEKMETFQDAVIREMWGEAGPDLVVSAPQLWTVTNTRFFDENKHYVVVFMVSDWISGEAKIMEPNKCECWHWFRWSERDLPSPLMKGIQMLVNIKEDPFKV